MKRYITILATAMVASWAPGKDLVASMYSDETAREVGDLLTVLIEEQSAASQEASNDRSKSSDNAVSVSVPSPLVGGENVWKAFTLPEWSANADKAFNAASSKAATDSLSAAVTVYVTEILPNGNLLIFGDRIVNIDGDLVKFTLSGMVRPADITSANQVYSSRIAGATITYKTQGELSQNAKKGFFSRLLDWVVPF